MLFLLEMLRKDASQLLSYRNASIYKSRHVRRSDRSSLIIVTAMSIPHSCTNCAQNSPTYENRYFTSLIDTAASIPYLIVVGAPPPPLLVITGLLPLYSFSAESQRNNSPPTRCQLSPQDLITCAHFPHTLLYEWYIASFCMWLYYQSPKQEHTALPFVWKLLCVFSVH